MKAKIKRGCLISFILLLIGIILWSDNSFLFIGLSIVTLGIVLLYIINDGSNQKKS
ncbi:MAG: hypothetical protein HFH08_04860 [Bacilli bacterium]|nr:hypothetical protein [Bacilli bacterium]